MNLDYPQSDISEISHDEETDYYHITTTFFGLYGVSSPLPGFFTEELLDDDWDELSGRKQFLDVIHNHVYPLLYQAWLKYKFSHNIVEFEDKKYAEIIFSLIGMGELYRDNTKRYGHLLKYSGLLSQRIKSMSGLQTLLRDYMGNVELNIKPCVKRNVPIVDKQRCMLGVQNSKLNSDVCIGSEVADRSGKLEIDIGPLNAEQFTAFSQSQETTDTIKTLINYYLVQPLDYSINLLLEPNAIVAGCLGDQSSSVLGKNCWTTSQSNSLIERVVFNDAVV